MPELILGPLLRYVGETEATVWVETDATAARSRSSATASRPSRSTGTTTRWSRIEDLEPGTASTSTRSRSTASGAGRSPAATFRRARSAPSAATSRSTSASAPAGSRFPHERAVHATRRPSTRRRARSSTRSACSRARWSATRSATSGRELLLLLGDQVYVDEGSPETRERIRARRGTAKPPGEEVTDFEEYTWLYQESWSDPMIRWLFSTVSISMVWDDHDMSDDWNISRSWLEEMRAQALVARARRRRHHELLDLPAPRQPLAARARPRTTLYRAGPRATATPASSPGCASAADEHRDRRRRWSYLPRPRRAPALIFIDSRAGRVLEEGRRSIFDEEEWDWIVEHAQRRLRPPADRDHGPVPALARLPPPRGLERAGLRRRLGRPGGARGARSCGAPSTSTTGPPSTSPSSGCASLLDEVGSGERGKAPASIVVLSGDVHHAYLAEVGFPRRRGRREPRLPGRLLAVPQPARRPRAAGGEDRPGRAPSGR